MKNKISALVIAYLIVFTNAKADVFRCKIGDKVSYSDMPCTNGTSFLVKRLPKSSEMIIATTEDNSLYKIDGKINGKDVRFLVDTGASIVSIPASMKDQLVLTDACVDRIFNTAGGNSIGCVTKAKTLRIGRIVLNNIDVAIMDSLKMPLLGVNAISRLGVATINGSNMQFSQPIK